MTTRQRIIMAGCSLCGSAGAVLWVHAGNRWIAGGCLALALFCAWQVFHDGGGRRR